jgi:hypothetical protein
MLIRHLAGLLLCRCYEADEGPASIFGHSPSFRLAIEGDWEMDRTSFSTPSGRNLCCVLELSKNSWLLAIQFPDRPQPSLYAIEGGNTEKLMTKLTAARDSWAKMSGAVPAITVCYEVGYDAFWL